MLVADSFYPGDLWLGQAALVSRGVPEVNPNVCSLYLKAWNNSSLSGYAIPADGGWSSR
jgi:hypothetical protein